MQSNSVDIRVHQSLHGYSNGHRLLECSVKLPREAEKIMLVLSDMSGPSMVKGFESYLTGYPLVDTNMYALAKTWYAREMNRPGCVWTHTLLVSTEDLSLISDLTQLSTLFARPSESHSFPDYKSQLCLKRYSFNDYSLCNRNDPSLDISASVLAALYVSPDKPVYIVALDSRKYEKLFFDIWDQQWPSLRASFSFCTGSISNRKLAGKALDLQAIPLEVERQLKREVPEGIFVDESAAGSMNSNYPSWISLLQSDLYCAQESGLRKLLWNLDDKDMRERKDCASLAEIANVIEKVKACSQCLPELTEAIAKAYPGGKDAINLKRKIYGTFTNDTNLFPIVDEFQLLRELSVTKHQAAFDGESLNIRQRTAHLWRTDRYRAQELMSSILATEFTPIGEEALKGITDTLKVTELVELYQKSPGLFHVVLTLNPSLAISADLWINLTVSKYIIIESLAKSKNITSNTIRAIIMTLLNSGISNVAESLVSNFKKIAVDSFLDWADSLNDRNSDNTNYCNASNFPDEWKYTIEKYPDMIVEWLKKDHQPKVGTLIFITTILNPNSKEALRAGTNVWMSLLEEKKINRYRDCLSVKVFLLTFGFNNPDNGAAKLVSFCFEEVHDALKSDNLGYKQWELIERHVPTLSWLSNWDKCERLRRALIDKFISYQWAYQEFLNAVQNKETLRRSLEYCRRSSEGKIFLKNLIRQLNNGTLNSSASQKKIILSAIQ
jgi:hypothetical protein